MLKDVTQLGFLLLCFIFWITSGAIKAEALNMSSEACPLNITAEVDAQIWMLQQCFLPDKSHCCQSINDLVKILHFSWMHYNRSFLLPTNQVAGVCLNELQREVQIRTGIGAEMFRSCNVGSESFVCDPGTCLGIENLATFESRVDTTELKLNCNGSQVGIFQCSKCLKSMGMALRSLNKEPGGKSNCPMFLLIYVAGGINCYDGLGPDAAYCLLSVQNVSSLANFPEPNRGNNVLKWYFIAIIPAVGILVIGLSICLCLNRRKTSLWKSKRLKLMQRYELLSSTTGLKFFSLSEIKDSTGNFAASNVIGEGGFSIVYRGILPNGTRIAVKRLKQSSKIKADESFSHELHVISGIKHRNLLPLRGYCIEFDKEGQVSEQLLVSDFMENGSLGDCLFNPNASTWLSWPQRYKIAVGIARGLTYLHEFAKPSIIHRDVKAANVLLDSHLNALVADFGLAKFKKEEEEKSHYSTRTVGTLGYVAPEYALYGHLTVKSDVFSFGIILLELITARRALDPNSGALEHFLISDWVVDMTQKNRSEEVIDITIRNSGHRNTINKVLLLALQCAHPRVVSRPSISEALLALEAIAAPSSGAKEIPEGLEAYSNSRGDFTWFLSPGGRTDESLSEWSNSSD